MTADEDDDDDDDWVGGRAKAHSTACQKNNRKNTPTPVREWGKTSGREGRS